ncbi:hypothetical protein G6F31_012326 [Rhizopus arrhizus]|nr:hypothetical protein G6F31_012326 [Rhizopus arrhizus]
MRGGQRDDEERRTVRVRLGQAAFDVAEHVLVGHAPGAGFGLGITGSQGLLVDEFMGAQMRGARAQIRREGVAGELGVGRGRLANGGHRAAHQQARQRIEGAVAFRQEAIEAPVLLPMRPQGTQQVASRLVIGVQVMPHAFHDLQHDVRRPRAGRRIGRGDGHEGLQALCGVTQEALVQRLAGCRRDRLEALVVAAFGQGPEKRRDAVGRNVVQEPHAGDAGVVLVQGEAAQRSAASQHGDCNDQQHTQCSRGQRAALQRQALHAPLPACAQPPRRGQHRRQQQPCLRHGVAVPQRHRDGAGVVINQAKYEDVDRPRKRGVVADRHHRRGREQGGQAGAHAGHPAQPARVAAAVQQRRHRERERYREADIAQVQHRRMDDQPRVLQQRIEVAAFQWHRIQAQERVGGEDQEGEEADADHTHHRQYARLHRCRQVPREQRYRAGPQRQYQCPHQQRAFVRAPHRRIARTEKSCCTNAAVSTANAPATSSSWAKAAGRATAIQAGLLRCAPTSGRPACSSEASNAHNSRT